MVTSWCLKHVEARVHTAWCGSHAPLTQGLHLGFALRATFLFALVHDADLGPVSYEDLTISNHSKLGLNAIFMRYSWMDVCMHVCMYGWIDGMDGCMYACMYGCVHTYVCMYLIYIYIYRNMYIYTMIGHDLTTYLRFGCIWIWCIPPVASLWGSSWSIDGFGDTHTLEWELIGSWWGCWDMIKCKTNI